MAFYSLAIQPPGKSWKNGIPSYNALLDFFRPEQSDHTSTNKTGEGCFNRGRQARPAPSAKRESASLSHWRRRSGFFTMVPSRRVFRPVSFAVASLTRMAASISSSPETQNTNLSPRVVKSEMCDLNGTCFVRRVEYSQSVRLPRF